MDFINRMLGRAPSTPIFEDGPRLAASRPMTPSMFTQPEPTRPQIEREMRRLLKTNDAAQVSIGQQMREDIFGGDAQKALKDLKRAMHFPHLGTCTGALMRLVSAETKRLGVATRSPLFQTNGEGQKIAVELLHRLGHEHGKGATYLRDPRYRDLLTRAMDTSDKKTQDALMALALSALTQDNSKDYKVLRWILRSLGKDRIELSPELLPRHAAHVVGPSVLALMENALECAEKAYANEDIPGTFNHLEPLAALEKIRDPEARETIRAAVEGPRERAGVLANRMLMDLTYYDNQMKKFRVSHSSPGWPTVLPFITTVDDDHADALEALAYYIMREYGNKHYNALRARAALTVIAEILERTGYEELEVTYNCREAVAWRPQPALFNAPLPEAPYEYADIVVSSY